MSVRGFVFFECLMGLKSCVVLCVFVVFVVCCCFCFFFVCFVCCCCGFFLSFIILRVLRVGCLLYTCFSYTSDAASDPFYVLFGCRRLCT